MTKWKKLSRNGYVLYDSNSMTFWKRQNYGDSEKIHGSQGLRGEKNKFLEQWNYPVWYHNNNTGDCVCVCVYVCTLVLSHVWLFATPWTVACQAPLSMEFPGKNAGVGCQFLLQEIFLTQGLNPCLLHCRQILYCWAIREAPWVIIHLSKPT